MKQILTFIALIAISLAAAAQNKPLVTLSHEGQLTFFDSVSAFEDAVDAAVDGDIIYLSEGNFAVASNSQSLKIIDKKISIIGSGYKSYIVPNLEFHFSSSTTLTAPLLDGLRVEELTIGNNNVSNDIVVDQVEIKKCKISSFSMGGTPNNVVFDRCYLNIFLGSSYTNVQFYNCKINEFGGYYCEILNNCNVSKLRGSKGYYPAYIVNSIIENPEGAFVNNRTIFENCIINGSFSTSSICRNCYDLTNSINDYLDDNLECTIDDMSPYVGTDGTVVGIYGGEWMPFSETPSVPTVDSSKSSVVYDKENNKLNVTITVATN